MVDTIAPISRPTISGSPPIQCSAKPMVRVAATTATTASVRIGTQSSIIRRMFISSVA